MVLSLAAMKNVAFLFGFYNDFAGKNLFFFESELNSVFDEVEPLTAVERKFVIA